MTPPPEAPFDGRDGSTGSGSGDRAGSSMQAGPDEDLPQGREDLPQDGGDDDEDITEDGEDDSAPRWQLLGLAQRQPQAQPLLLPPQPLQGGAAGEACGGCEAMDEDDGRAGQEQQQQQLSVEQQQHKQQQHEQEEVEMEVAVAAETAQLVAARSSLPPPPAAPRPLPEALEPSAGGAGWTAAGGEQAPLGGLLGGTDGSTVDDAVRVARATHDARLLLCRFPAAPPRLMMPMDSSRRTRLVRMHARC